MHVIPPYNGFELTWHVVGPKDNWLRLLAIQEAAIPNAIEKAWMWILRELSYVTVRPQHASSGAFCMQMRYG